MQHTSLRVLLIFTAAIALRAGAATLVTPVTAPEGMVVAGHPEAAAAGVEVLCSGGNAMDAAVAVSLALGVAEPYGSGLGGKLMLLHFDSATGSVVALDGMDQAGAALDPEAYRGLGPQARFEGWTAVAVPGLAAALHAGHARWGSRPWAENVQPAVVLARAGFTVLPKTRAFFEERLEKLRADASLAELFLPGGELPAVGSRLPNPALADTLELLAREGANGFYRGPIAQSIAAAARSGGGHITLGDLERYAVRFATPVGIDFRGCRILGGPPPTTGASLALAILKVLEAEDLELPLRSARNIDLIGRIWREVLPLVRRDIADTNVALDRFDAMVAPAAIDEIRRRAGAGLAPSATDAPDDAVHDATTHFAVVDRDGNVVCATQSLSLHFGAGVAVAGVVMNDSMSNFTYGDEESPNLVNPGRRPRSTIAPTLVLRSGKPVLAVGVAGAQRIPTAVLQALVDWLMLGRPLEEAIGDTRVHWYDPLAADKPLTIEAENSLPVDVAADLRRLGWAVDLREAPGTGRHFGGLNAIALNPDGSRTGYADPRRSNAAAGH